MAEDILHRAETVESPLKLDLHNPTNLTTVMHLLMYEHSKLVQESIELLMTVFTARNNLVKDVLRAQVLFEDDEVQQYKVCDLSVIFIVVSIIRFLLR
jgi:hypothetical protein